MKKALSYLTLINLLFLFFLAVSGFISGAVGKIIYYLAFLIPAAVAFLLRHKLDTPPALLPLKLSGKSAALLLPLIAPTLALVFFISWLTSILLSFIGEGSVADVSGNIVTVILTHAVLTALLEELLFRYIPIAFISPITKRGAVWISALFFAFAHCNLYQIPYAFVAGVIFAAIDIAFDSIWPSVSIHFANNLISILWLRNLESGIFVTAYIIILAALALISIAVALLFRKRYKRVLADAFIDKGDCVLSCVPLLFIAVALAVAVLNL